MDDSQSQADNSDVLSETHERDDERFADDTLDDVALARGVVTTPRDLPIQALLAEIASGQLIVSPKFQRDKVWGSDRQAKLIESLLLNIPIPMLYFAEDDDGTRVVVDGQQRLKAVAEFHAGKYALKRLDVLPKLNGKRWNDLTPKQMQTIVQSVFRCVVISADSPASLRFEMFERLSTGGMPLNEQELRNCVFRGAFNDLLHELVRTTPWLSAVGKPSPELRMRHEELALRFFALRNAIPNYRPPLKPILNEFMRSHRNAGEPEILAFAAVFERALTNCLAVFDAHCFRRVVQAKGRPERWESNLNRAIFDVQMLCLADLPTQLVRDKAAVIDDVFRRLSLTNPDFQTAISTATSDRATFYARLRLLLLALRDAGIDSPLLDRLPAA
jgi:hypothetical protein